MASLAYEALVIEARRWLHPEPAGAPPHVVAPVAPAPVVWKADGPRFTRCIACAAEISEHPMLCPKCISDRERWARERENPRPRRARRRAVPSPTGDKT